MYRRKELSKFSNNAVRNIALLRIPVIRSNQAVKISVPLITIVCWACLTAPGSSCFGKEPILLDIRDDYYVGESLQIRLILPAQVDWGWLLLQGPDGGLTSLLPNELESFAPGRQHARKRLFPDPAAAYQVILKEAGRYRAWSIHLPGENTPSLTWQWPRELPDDFPAAFQKLRSSTDGVEDGSAMIYSHLDFTVQDGKRAAIEKLDLKDGILDGASNPSFLPHRTRLATSEDYRLLWKWARLMNSPAHRHQCFLIECHATTAISRKANLVLSEDRAESIVAYLVDHCHVPKERLTAVGKGDFEPLSGQSANASTHNRITLVLDNAAGARMLR